MSKVYDKDGVRIKTYDKDGHEIGVVSTLDADAQWREQYEQTLLAERAVIIEAVAIVIMLAAQLFKTIRR